LNAQHKPGDDAVVEPNGGGGIRAMTILMTSASLHLPVHDFRANDTEDASLPPNRFLETNSKLIC